MRFVAPGSSCFPCLNCSNYCFCGMLCITCVSHVAALQELLQLGAATISPDDPLLSVDDLADQVAEVLNYFG